jgi:dTDP-4-amino-4,6-dideoxygalactose transaminase
MKDVTPIFVTQPELPSLENFIPYLEQIWANKILTNGGPFHVQLERKLCEYLGVEHIALFANGTIALMTALEVMGISGEVITTPFSFVATAHSLLWNRIKPVFVDIDPVSLNIDAACIEKAITRETTAIMPVHCYGSPCDVEAIHAIAKRHGLKVIYDAAHAFAVKYQEGSVLRHGDLSVLSFHATKVFNTFEGGAVVCHDAGLKQRIDCLKNFGIEDEVSVSELGINGKMNEIQAAFGLLQLGNVDLAIAARSRIDQQYRDGLKNLKGIECPPLVPESEANYSYFPILVRPSYRMTRDALFQRLKEEGIFARRYFYPLISEFSVYRRLPSAAPENLPVATQVARQVLCLPIYPKLSAADVQRVISVIRG